MPTLGLADTHPRRNVRLDTLVRLRWLAIIGQTTAVLAVQYGLDFDLLDVALDFYHACLTYARGMCACRAGAEIY